MFIQVSILIVEDLNKFCQQLGHTCSKSVAIMAELTKDGLLLFFVRKEPSYPPNCLAIIIMQHY